MATQIIIKSQRKIWSVLQLYKRLWLVIIACFNEHNRYFHSSVEVWSFSNYNVFISIPYLNSGIKIHMGWAVAAFIINVTAE